MQAVYLTLLLKCKIFREMSAFVIATQHEERVRKEDLQSPKIDNTLKTTTKPPVSNSVHNIVLDRLLRCLSIAVGVEESRLNRLTDFENLLK